MKHRIGLLLFVVAIAITSGWSPAAKQQTREQSFLPPAAAFTGEAVQIPMRDGSL